MAIVERNGRFRVIYRGADGRQHSAGTFGSRKEANAAYIKAKADVLRTGIDQPKAAPAYPVARRGKVTVASYAEATWLPNHRLQPHARESYTTVLRRHVLPAFGTTAVSEMTAADIRKFFRQLEDSGKSGPLMAKIKTVMSAMFQTAAEDGLIPANPVRGVRIKATPAKRRKAFTVDQYRQFLGCIPARYRLLVRTMAETGLRWEEAIALRGEHVDGQVIYVRHVLQELAHPRRFELRDGTKNGKARQLKISAELAAELDGDGFLFLGEDGRHIGLRYFSRRIWGPALKACGMEGFTPRDLRRTHATWIREGGASLEVVRDRLGHGNVATTDRYLAEPRDGQDMALDALQKTLRAS